MGLLDGGDDRDDRDDRDGREQVAVARVAHPVPGTRAAQQDQPAEHDRQLQPDQPGVGRGVERRREAASDAHSWFPHGWSLVKE